MAGTGRGPLAGRRRSNGHVSYLAVDTPIGRLVLAAGDRGVVACSYQSEEVVAERLGLLSPDVTRSGRGLDAVRHELDRYLAGRLQAFTVPVDLALATPFARTVLGSLGAVPYGGTTTYGELARLLGRPGASRAVGSALGSNPVCVVVPCHRVLRWGGGLGGYAGGVEAKRRLLALESAPGSDAVRVSRPLAGGSRR